MSNDYLMHYGIKGMKWGVRRYQNSDGTLTSAGKRRYGEGKVGEARFAYKQAKKEYNKAFRKAYYTPNTRYDPDYMQNRAKRRWKTALKKGDEVKAAKETYKREKSKADKSAVKSYNKQFYKAERASNVAEQKWDDVKSQYKNLGRNAVSRFINASKDTDAARKYRSDFNKATSMEDYAEEQWKRASEKYKKTGRNRVERLVNNIRY